MSISYFASSIASLSVSYILRNSGIQTATNVVFSGSLNYLLISSIFDFIVSRDSNSFFWSSSWSTFGPPPYPIIPLIDYNIPPNFSLNSIIFFIPLSRILGKSKSLNVWPVGAVSKIIKSNLY